MLTLTQTIALLLPLLPCFLTLNICFAYTQTACIHSCILWINQMNYFTTYLNLHPLEPYTLVLSHSAAELTNSS